MHKLIGVCQSSRNDCIIMSYEKWVQKGKVYGQDLLALCTLIVGFW